MHTRATERSRNVRLGLLFGISNQQNDNVIAMATNRQMPVEHSTKNHQQRRGRRRRQRRECEVAGCRGAFGTFCLSINLAILICLAHSTNAVPTDSITNSASSTIVTVAVTPTSISSTSSSNNTSESLLEQQQPQGQCLLNGLWVPETSANCTKRASCRAIQRTGHCCPDYKCDCEKDGISYENGHKLVNPDTPCIVCYCKGGEIVCSSVTCFRRDDCMPKYVPGRCCPEYDNCPILDNNPPLGSESSSVAPQTAKSAQPAAPPAGFNSNITIKEITKPTEIRITDDNHKVKQTIPTRKVTTTDAPSSAATSAATTPTTTTAATSTTTTAAATVTESTTAIVSTEAPSTTAAAAATTSAAIETTATPTHNSALSMDTNPQKALPVTGNESLKLIASVGYIERPLNNNNNIGGQQLKPLVSYTADGLQPLAENDPRKVNIKREYTTEGVAVAVGADSTFMQNGFRDALVENNNSEGGAAATGQEPETAGSDNIYHIISTTEGPGSGSSSSISSSSTTEHQLSTEGIMRISEESSTYGNINNTLELESSTEGLMLSSTSSSSESPASSTPHAMHHMEEEEVPQVESNPAYPSLPEDDFSLRDVNFPLVEMEELVEGETTKDEQRSITGPFERDNKRTKQVTDNILDASGNGSGAGSGAGSGDMEFFQTMPSTTEYMVAQASGQEKLTQVPLMYSAEDISAETRIQNVSELATISERQRENETSGEFETGSGNGDLREPTTPRATRIPALDIDELGSGAGQAQSSTAEDPKADAESLKLDESQAEQADSAAKTNNAGKATSRAEKSFVEQNEAEAGLRLERLYLQRIY